MDEEWTFPGHEAAQAFAASIDMRMPSNHVRWVDRSEMPMVVLTDPPETVRGYLRDLRALKTVS